MTKKNLIQELRESADELREIKKASGGLDECMMLERFTGVGIKTCEEVGYIPDRNKHRALFLDTIADRIEAEYEPKPEQDTLEDAARDMMGYMATVGESCEAPSVGVLKDFRNRLEALGVKFDGD